MVVVDPEPKRAGFVAEEARELFGVRPRDFRSLEEAVAAFPDLAMVDIVATAGAHHSIAQVAFEAGLEVLTEKPMAPTVSACRAMQATAQEHGRILSIVPEFALDDRTVRYFGGRRLARYQQSTWHGARESDLKLLAMEVSELLDAIEKGTPIEVGPEEGLAAVALVMAFHESSEAGRWVSMEEVVDGTLSTFQDVANRELGLA